MTRPAARRGWLAMGLVITLVIGLTPTVGHAGGAPGEDPTGVPRGAAVFWSLVRAVRARNVRDPTGSLESGGRTRTYRWHVPARPFHGRMPLVLVLHGGGGDGRGMVALTLGVFDQLADRDGFLVVYPDGYRRAWNDGRGLAERATQRQGVDDVAFLSDLIGHFASRFPIDERRVYACGISNGGMMSFRLACELSEKIAAVGVVASGMGERLAPGCFPPRPVSVLLLSGTDDPLVPYAGGDVKLGRRKMGRVISTRRAVDLWVNRNGCSVTPQVEWLPDVDADDGTRVQRAIYGGGREGAEVVLETVRGGGHTWPGGLQYLPEILIGRTSRDLDASQEIWTFFRRHAR